MKSQVYPKKPAHQAPAPATRKGWKYRGYQGYVNQGAIDQQRKDLEKHQAIMGERPRGYVRGMADFSAGELAALTAKLQRWMQEGTR